MRSAENTRDLGAILLSGQVVGVGCTEVLGPDTPIIQLPPYPAHNLLHKNNCFSLALLANLDKMPATGAALIAAPLKIEHGTGSPVRALALVPKG